MRGAAPKAIQELAGHSTLAMTMRYIHLAPIALRQAIVDIGARMAEIATASSAVTSDAPQSKRAL